jgi:hypothetical protein
MKRDKISNDKIIKALHKHCGIVQSAATMLKIDRGTLAGWIKDDEELQKAQEAAREGLLDEMESKLLQNVRDGKEASIIFGLKTLGRNRGYVERIEYAEHIEQELFPDGNDNLEPEPDEEEEGEDYLNEE